MEPTSHGLNEVTNTNEKTLAMTKVSRGISLRACVAKATVGPLRRPMLYLFKRLVFIKHHDFE